MNPGKIWRGQIGNSIRFLTNVTNLLRDDQSAVIHMPSSVPWRQEFYSSIDSRRSTFSVNRRLKRLKWDNTTDPGEFILDRLCSIRVQADYWPGQSCAEYLGVKDDIMLNDYYVWVTDIHSKAGLSKWVEFVRLYENSAKGRAESAVFLLEYDGVPVEVIGLEKLAYSVESYDCRVFCLEIATTSDNENLRSYQAELAFCIGHGNPELCAVLLEKGHDLLTEPVVTAQSLLENAHSSEGAKFAELSDSEIESAVWKASIISLFPILEQYRFNFILAHEADLSIHLPISNFNSNQITDPHDLEIGAIQHIVSCSNHKFSPSDADMLRLCRKVRNLLAHNKIVPYDDVCKLLTLL